MNGAGIVRAVRVCWASSMATDLMTPKGGVTFAEDGSPTYKKDGGGPPEYGISKSTNYFLGYEFGKRSGNSDGVLHNVSFPLAAAWRQGLGLFGTLLWGEV